MLSFRSLSTTVLLIFGFSISAQAGTAFAFADQQWKNADEVDAFMQVPVCRAFTAASDSTEPVELSLSFAKDGKLLPMIRLQTKLTASRIDVKISSTVTEPLFLLKSGAGADGSNIYWYAPVNFARFEGLIREAMTLQLVVDPKGQPLPIKISLSGSNNSLNQAMNCLKGIQEPTDFLKLLNTQKDALTPDLGDRSAAFLRQATEAAYAAYLAGQGTAAAIAKLQKPFASLLASETAWQKTVAADEIALTKAQAALASLSQELATLPGKISADQANLAQLTQQKPGADADLKAKKATYQTLLPQMTPYSKAITDAAALVKKTQDGITNDQNLIVKNTKRIQNDKDESARLTAALPTLRARVNRTAEISNRAADAYNSFSVSGEIDRGLRNSGSYQMALSNVRSDQSHVEDAQRKVNDARSKSNSADSAWRSCMSNPATSKNCSSQQSAMMSAQSNLNFAQNTLNSAQSSLSSHQNDVAREKGYVESRVRGQANELYSAYNNARSAYDNAKGEYEDAQGRIHDIPGEIVSLQAAIDKATAEIPVLQQQLVAAQTQQVNAQSAYDQFAKQIGFDVATSQMQAAQLLDDTINKGIAAMNAEIPVLQKQLKRDQANLPDVQATAAQAQKALTAAQAKLAPIQAQLKPYYDQVAPLLAEQAQELLSFQTQRAAYQDLYQVLAAN